MKNLQGDVVQIRSVYGTVVVEYTYDAWGNVLSITGLYADTLGQTNPIRYRGYYQDFETGFYYLQSRYYDPAIRRFINADGYVNANGDFIGFNMYAYCGNNPIAYVDVSGDSAAELAGLTAGATALSAIDGPLPIGDIIGAAMLLIGVVVISEAVEIENFRPFPTLRRPIVKEKEKTKSLPPPVSLEPKYNYWSAIRTPNAILPDVPLTYSEARQYVEAGGDIVCKNWASAYAIVKFYPSARWDAPHGSILKGYLPHFHLSSAHTNHIWYYG